MSGDTMHIASGDLSYASFTESDLFAGERDIRTVTETLKDVDGVVAQYSVLGRITATGKLVLSNPAATDGSEVPVRVSCYAADATATDIKAACYESGFFNIAKLVWHAGYDTEAKKLAAFNYAGANILVGKLLYSVG